jgi:ATP-dependent helicase/nuclease subunit A
VALRESGYLFELRGRRLPQARENLKKVRALLRRLENRGYVTQARVAAHLDRLALGDEANAAVDALDAVHLMTVHASKGLEFPVVFLVNLSKGTGSWGDPIRVSTDAAGDDISVSVGSFQSDADEERGAHEQEETKRLLYVALTRARDSLYLAMALKDGRTSGTRGSFSEAMPSSLLDLFATGVTDRVEWIASSGARHEIAVCRPHLESADHPADANPAPSAREPDDFEPLRDPSTPPRAVSTAVSEAVVSAAATHLEERPDESERRIGRIVHRLLQRYGFDAGDDRVLLEAAVRIAGSSADGGEDAITPRVDVAAQAVSAYHRIRERADVQALLGSGEPLREVPFSLRAGNAVVRGTIDCLILAPGRVVVLEFKTGRPHSSHRAQVELYRQAAQHLFPGTPVETLLVYAGDTRNGTLKLAVG